MTEMIERVARALARFAGNEIHHEQGGVPYRGWKLQPAANNLDDYVNRFWPQWSGQAVAAIEAMREPTDAMVVAGLVENSCDLPEGRRLTMAVEPAYEAMIDAALKP